ncbi:flavin-nucleotide-binding protein [Cladophialophora carrionii]|uniref:Flavin-nucleotide-binding protein n=1 Tax=Cladophialophora carrionii TaxID=86049 RepID=A0A1C1C7R3_9EURO|nr:flavin-nucleotide-binding protein [Cladophialophora carrionii]
MGHGRTLEYPKTPINRVNRYNQRATYDLEQIHTIINTSTVLHVSFNTPDAANPFPVTLPSSSFQMIMSHPSQMVGVAASFDHPSSSLGEPLDVYLHGYVSSRLMNLSRRAETGAEVGGTATSAPEAGLPVTISATKVDGLVLTLTPNTHDVNYRSATVYGYATLVSSTDEKLWAMETITNSVVSGRWAHTRVPPDTAEMTSTSILKVKVVGGSGKIRVGGPRDERKDLDRADVRAQVWTGTIPVWESFGDPVAFEGVSVGDGKGNLVPVVPEHVVSFVRERRGENERYALAAVEDRSQD